MSTALRTWVRARRRSPGEDVKVPGPWHAIYEWDQTWCGRRLRVLTQDRVTEVVRVEPTCTECLRAIDAGRPRAWRRR